MKKADKGDYDQLEQLLWGALNDVTNHSKPKEKRRS